MQNNKQNQPCPKSLRTKESTITKHSEAFSIGESRLLDPKENLELQVLRYPHPHLYQNPSVQLMPSFSNFLFSNQYNTTIADQLLQAQILPQSNAFQVMPLKSLAAEGMRIVCEIDILMLRHYYHLREQIFNKHNQTASKRMDNNSNQIDWIKGRFQYRFKEKISKMMCKLVDEVKSLLNNKTEDDQQINIEKLRFLPEELIQLDKELKEKREDSSEYLDPYEVCRRIAKLIEMYFRSSDQ
ncbi:unnamed protein product (macronuclear) [Paramecium tetraurelia]|uniref:Uncharacterized protein n=1 Tax=Paramecium tetraurelia TaxID=5888 RepID=A0CLA6_PARTE|nr:uncharacterized protein GSPATT00008120001 [Paramecium tetraurelia]CAK71573.1 unnamed protein product [Paramecium tetraurelia]|eukprot:XP_001438970.1 hypothetical protein (macronuclear) [Paramecium tetraurelia strain d4-2]